MLIQEKYSRRGKLQPVLGDRFQRRNCKRSHVLLVRYVYLHLRIIWAIFGANVGTFNTGKLTVNTWLSSMLRTGIQRADMKSNLDVNHAVVGSLSWTSQGEEVTCAVTEQFMAMDWNGLDMSDMFHSRFIPQYLSVKQFSKRPGQVLLTYPDPAKPCWNGPLHWAT